MVNDIYPAFVKVKQVSLMQGFFRTQYTNKHFWIPKKEIVYPGGSQSVAPQDQQPQHHIATS